VRVRAAATYSLAARAGAALTVRIHGWLTALLAQSLLRCCVAACLRLFVGCMYCTMWLSW
jgi:hypothetical protein